jgi:hypothetical protein
MRYIDADALIERLKFKRDTDNIDRNKYAGLECAIAQCKKAPTADVVPKSEVEYWKQQYFHACVSNGCVDEKVIEYLRTNAEGHNDPVGEDGVDGLESAITQAKSEVAREIFEEIEREINDALQSNYKVLPQIEESEALWNRVNGKIDALRGIRGFIDELKEKYTEEQSNA